jgi:MerR family transcriptional regulator/heat shock protein HspR
MKRTSDPAENRPLYTLGIASELSDIPAHSIRQYIDRGLLIPYKRETNRHLFSPSDIRRLKHLHSLIQEKGLNFAGIRAMLSMLPCWAIRPCSESDREACNAYGDDAYPCWEASEKSRICKNEDCRECQVYQSLSRHENMKSVVRSLF